MAVNFASIHLVLFVIAWTILIGCILSNFLSIHDNSDGFPCHHVVIATFLATDEVASLPAWLLQSLRQASHKSGCYAAYYWILLSLYVKYDRLTTAAALLKEYVRLPCHMRTLGKLSEKCTPVMTLDRLRSVSHSVLIVGCW